MATPADISAALQQAGVTVYGDEMQWKRIWEANKDKIPNPDVVRQGLELTIRA